MANYILQLKRNASFYPDKGTAIERLKAKLETALEGEPIISTYLKDGDEFILLGIKGVAGKYQIFEGSRFGADGKSIEIPSAVKDAIDKALEDVKSDAGTYTDFGKVEDKLEAIDATINAMDYSGATGGSVITQVTQEDGKISATASNLASADKTVTVNGLDLKVNVDNNTIKVNGSGALYVDPAATSVTGKDAVKVTDIATGKQVELVIAAANKVLTQTTTGLDTTLGLNFVKASDNTADGANKGKAVIQLTGVGGAVLGEFDATDLVMDGVLDRVEYDKVNGTITFTWSAAAGKTATTVDLKEYIKPYSNGDGLDLTEQVFSVKVKDGDKYLTVDTNGVASKGIDEAITAAIEALDSTKGDATVQAGKHVAVQVVQTDGKIETLTVAENDIASAAALATAEGKITALETAIGEGGSVESQITSAIEALDNTDTVVEGQYVTKVDTVDGIATPSRRALLSSDDNNALSLGTTDKGLYLSTTLDCGTY